MKLISKFVITAGVLAATTIGVSTYGIYSYTRFNDTFQGKGWYYYGVKYTSKNDALNAKRQTMKTVHKDIISINVGKVGSNIEIMDGVGLIQEPGNQNLSAIVIKTFAGSESIQIYGDSEIGKSLKAVTNKADSKEIAKIVFGNHDNPTEIFNNFGISYTDKKVENGKHKAKIQITNTALKNVAVDSIDEYIYDPLSGSSALKDVILDDPRFIKWLLNTEITFDVRSIEDDDLLLVTDEDIKHVI